jgi:hypothetical protein
VRQHRHRASALRLHLRAVGCSRAHRTIFCVLPGNMSAFSGVSLVNGLMEGHCEGS